MKKKGLKLLSTCIAIPLYLGCHPDSKHATDDAPKPAPLGVQAAGAGAGLGPAGSGSTDGTILVRRQGDGSKAAPEARHPIAPAKTLTWKADEEFSILFSKGENPCELTSGVEVDTNPASKIPPATKWTFNCKIRSDVKSKYPYAYYIDFKSGPHPPPPLISVMLKKWQHGGGVVPCTGCYYVELDQDN